MAASEKQTLRVRLAASSEAACVAAVGVFAWIAAAIPAAFADDVGLVPVD